MDLTSCRAIGMGEGPIPWLAVRQYAVDAELEEESREDLFYFIGKMDTAYLEHRAKTVKEKAAKSG